MPANTVKVDRSTPLGNPFTAKDYGQARAIRLFCAWISGQPIANAMRPGEPMQLARRRAALWVALPGLRGKHLACWCPLPEKGRPDSCHAAVLLALANAEANAALQSCSRVPCDRAVRMLRKVME